jgi:hypothetical protein
MSWLAGTTPPGRRGRAMSLRLSGNGLGQVAIPSTAGLLAAGTGAAGVLVLTAGALAAVGYAARRFGDGPAQRPEPLSRSVARGDASSARAVVRSMVSAATAVPITAGPVAPSDDSSVRPATQVPTAVPRLNAETVSEDARVGAQSADDES